MFVHVPSGNPHSTSLLAKPKALSGSWGLALIDGKLEKWGKKSILDESKSLSFPAERLQTRKDQTKQQQQKKDVFVIVTQ